MPWARASAPLRVLDAGGWTDTWFARSGAVCHLAVGPGPEVLAQWQPSAGPTLVEIALASTGEVYGFDLERPPGRHPLIEAVVARCAPRGGDLRAEVGSPVPPGSSLGTSAAVVVALACALQHLDGTTSTPAALARLAHRVETVDLGRQSGVQDQVAAAFGGANYVRVTAYPHFEVEPLQLPQGLVALLEERLFTVYLGAHHDSSEVHKSVISDLESGVVGAQTVLQPLRQAADEAARAMTAGDLAALGRAMVANTEAQALLHPGLISAAARAAIDVARDHGALGWKVNGAGGPGGTVSVIHGRADSALGEALAALPGARVLTLSLQAVGAAVVEHG